MDLTTSPGAGPALGMIGLGRMGANLVRRLVAGGGTAAVFDTDPAVAVALAEELGAAVTPAATLDELVAALAGPRAVWVMVPASVAGTVVGQVAALLSPGDVVIDGGNTDWREDAPRAAELAEAGIAMLDVGTSGGVWGLERGYCMMVGGPDEAVATLSPVFDVLSPPADSVERTPGRDGGLSRRRTGLAALRPQRSGPLREDGPQRHRVRPDGGVRRGTQPAGAHRAVRLRHRPARR